MTNKIKRDVANLRKRGLTYSEIQGKLGLKIPKSTLSYWCKNISLPKDYFKKIDHLNKKSLQKTREKAWKINKKRRDNYLQLIKKANQATAKLINQKEIAKLFLSALYLGEGKKYKRDFCFGNSNPKIINLFLKLLKTVFLLDEKKLRFTVQCRADQNTKKLEGYWSKFLNMPNIRFYKARVDPRTVGKPTRNKDYKGVLRVDYFDTKARLELECLTDLIYQHLKT